MNRYRFSSSSLGYPAQLQILTLEYSHVSVKWAIISLSFEKKSSMSDHFTEWSFYWIEKTWNSCWKNRPLFENPLCFEAVFWAQNQHRPFRCLFRCSCNDFPYFLCKLLVKYVCWQNKTRFRSFTSTFSYLVVSEKRSFYWVIILLSWKFIRKKRKTIILLSDHFTETWLYFLSQYNVM